MNINVDEFNKVNLIIAGLFQYEENALFVQTELALTDDELLFYDDSEPSIVKGEEFRYCVKKRVPLSDYGFVVNEIIRKNRELANMGRLIFVSKDPEKTFIYYYFVQDKKDVTYLLKALKKKGIKSKTEKVDLSHENM